MLTNASREISHISDDDAVNSSNYIESISFIDRLYTINNILKSVLGANGFIFEPTFKGRYTCAKFGIMSNDDENEMRVFLIRPTSALEDDELNKDIDALRDMLTGNDASLELLDGEIKIIVKGD